MNLFSNFKSILHIDSILENYTEMTHHYHILMDLNRELLSEWEKKVITHERFVQSLKQVNQMISKAANLRIGSAKSEFIHATRREIKNNNMHALFRILRNGSNTSSSSATTKTAVNNSNSIINNGGSSSVG